MGKIRCVKVSLEVAKSINTDQTALLSKSPLCLQYLPF